MPLSVAILAAGKGVRMKSDIPKVLHNLAGQPLLEHVVRVAEALKADKIYVVYGDGGEKVHNRLSHLKVQWVEQKMQKGTADAVKQVLPLLNPKHRLLVLYGDVPLISKETLKRLIERTPQDAIGWLTDEVKFPGDLGRIVRDDDGNPVAIIEAKDATEEQKSINEINTGICLLPAKYLHAWIPEIKNCNAQNEFYLTDIFAMAVKHGVNITTVSPDSSFETLGVNNNVQLAYLERVFQRQQAENYMHNGLTLLDPSRIDVRGNLTFGKDVVIDVNVIMEGDVVIGKSCYIGPNVILNNVNIGNNVEIKANSILEESEVNDDCVVGPFARLRPGTTLMKKAKVGNFVEVKKSVIGEDSKASHLTYIGDTKIGKHVNIGAGTVTCNYDGQNKSETLIEDNVFIGSNSSIVAPLTIGKNATIGAGSVITQDTPPGKLTLARSRQVTINHWKRPVKENKK